MKNKRFKNNLLLITVVFLLALAGHLAFGLKLSSGLLWYSLPIYPLIAYFLTNEFKDYSSPKHIIALIGLTVLATIQEVLHWPFSGHILWNTFLLLYLYNRRTLNLFFILVILSFIHLILMKLLFLESFDHLGVLLGILIGLITDLFLNPSRFHKYKRLLLFITTLLTIPASLFHSYPKQSKIINLLSNPNARNLILIIPGSELPIQIQKQLHPVLHFTGIEKNNYQMFHQLGEYLQRKDNEVVIFDWGYSFFLNAHVFNRALELRDFLAEQTHRNIYIIAKSMGGVLLDKALEESHYTNIKRILKIASPELINQKKNLLYENTIHIYSSGDFFLKTITSLHLYLQLPDPAQLNQVIHLEDFSHNELTTQESIYQIIRKNIFSN